MLDVLLNIGLVDVCQSHFLNAMFAKLSFATQQNSNRKSVMQNVCRQKAANRAGIVQLKLRFGAAAIRTWVDKMVAHDCF